MTDSPLASFLLPDGFARPGLATLLNETSLGPELARYVLRAHDQRLSRLSRPHHRRPAHRATEPVLLVPGFLAGDWTLTLMAKTLRERGFRTYRSGITANVGCTLDAATLLESRLEEIVDRTDRRVQIVGHSLGGMLARGIAVRRPDLVSGIVTMGSPMLAPGAHHGLLSRGVEALVALNRFGVPGVMSAECVAGSCARESFEESREAMPDGVGFTAIYSRRDGIVDWRACVDPEGHPVEVTASHVGMAVDPRVIDHVGAALRRQADVASTPSLRIA
ncbi:triacylglycerol lipase [Nocardioides sp. R-C-SC26]|uniref:esterase/lipase family protein n=1 Tax=Nocardioides sp. R-C-SC26 TaxID=2870414 RepID=UPI001E5EB683|nr:alpha/beta hydrolase [Nocardioides sp. R-C-SC26]